MKKVLIVGIGSPFGADQLGWQVIDELQQRTQIIERPPQQYELVKLDRPGAALVETMRGYEQVILIDAVQSGQSRGTPVVLTADEIIRNNSNLSSHGFGIADSIALASALQQLPDKLILTGLDIGSISEYAFTKQDVIGLGVRIMQLTGLNNVEGT
ncbi:MAG: hydrogenase maturation protease [Woeseia sp.]